jgi:prevent-host-death family protein
MKTAWPMRDAKNRLHELVARAIAEGPQTISRHGKETAVVLSIRDYRRLTRPKGDLVDFFRKSPMAVLNLEVSRERDPGREVRL